jgi:transcriptional regulator with AAA-type ATPase domain
MISFIAKGGISAALAICFAAVAYNLDAGWARDWWWFITGMNVGFALTALFHEWLTAKSRRQMRAEMNAMGNDIIRQMREIAARDPFVSLVPDDREPPRLQ